MYKQNLVSVATTKNKRPKTNSATACLSNYITKKRSSATYLIIKLCKKTKAYLHSSLFII